MKPFAIDIDESDIKKERRKARKLRHSKWWQRKCAKGLCYYCGRLLSPNQLTMDHIVPISRGGKTSKGNVVTACKECNTAKKQLLPMEWKQYLSGVRLNKH